MNLLANLFELRKLQGVCADDKLVGVAVESRNSGVELEIAVKIGHFLDFSNSILVSNQPHRSFAFEVSDCLQSDVGEC